MYSVMSVTLFLHVQTTNFYFCHNFPDFLVHFLKKPANQMSDAPMWHKTILCYRSSHTPIWHQKYYSRVSDIELVTVTNFTMVFLMLNGSVWTMITKDCFVSHGSIWHLIGWFFKKIYLKIREILTKMKISGLDMQKKCHTHHTVQTNSDNIFLREYIFNKYRLLYF